jgi:hypothetical protein
MPLTGGEIEELKANHFHIDLLEMRLTRRGNAEDVYSGSGFIQQNADGEMEFRLYDRTRQPTTNFGSFVLGSHIEDEQYYDLEARDITGQEVGRQRRGRAGEVRRKPLRGRRLTKATEYPFLPQDNSRNIT